VGGCADCRTYPQEKITSLSKQMGTLLKALLDFIFPPYCLLCGASLNGDETGMCAHCRAQIRYIESPMCSRCGKPFYSEVVADHLCGECLTRKRYFTIARAMGHYDGMLREAIHLLKYREKQILIAHLGELLIERMSSFLSESNHQVIVAVPLHPKRLRERGFNQALSLAGVVSKHTAIPLERDTLARVRYTAPQVGLSEEERRGNVKGAFALLRADKVRDKTILLVDDVYTSGTTVEECSRALLKGGALRVDVLTLARVS